VKAVLLSGLTLVALATALSTGWEIMFRLAYTMLGVLLISFVWAWGNVRWLRYQYEIKTTRAQVGGQIEERLTLENSFWLPKLWVEIRDHSTLIGRRGNRVVALGGYAKRSFSLVTPCHVRGEFTLGPVTVVSGDPFGLFRRQRRLDIGGTVIIYPAVVDLTSFGRLRGELPGGSAVTQRAHFVTPNAAGVRDYSPGDSLCRIHWPTSARQRKLMVKEFELDPMSDVWLVLDMDGDVHLGEGDDSTEEWSVKICASLVSYFIGQQREVGVITQERVLPADRGYRQLHKALDLLAVVHTNSNTPLEQLVLSDEVRFARGSTAVIITPSTDERWPNACRLLAARGVMVLAVVLEASTFGGKESSLMLVGTLAALGVPTYLVKRGDDLSRTLARPSLVSA